MSVVLKIDKTVNNAGGMSDWIENNIAIITDT